MTFANAVYWPNYKVISECLIKPGQQLQLSYVDGANFRDVTVNTSTICSVLILPMHTLECLLHLHWGRFIIEIYSLLRVCVLLNSVVRQMVITLTVFRMSFQSIFTGIITSVIGTEKTRNRDWRCICRLIGYGINGC